MTDMDADQYGSSALGAFDREDLETAVKISTEGLSRFPDDASLYRLRSTFFEAMKEFEKAIADIKQFNRLQSNNATALEYEGSLLAQAGDLLQAESAYTRSIKIRDDYALIYFHRGKIRLQLGKTDEGIEDLRRYLELQQVDDIEMKLKELINALQ